MPQTTSAPTISVVMAAYNAERTIGAAIASVLGQTYSNFELIICDDASTDSTTDVIGCFTDGRIRLIRNTTNIQAGLSRDRAIHAARGTWVTVLDADDQFIADRLETLLRVAEEFPDDLVADGIFDCHDSPSGLVPWRTVWNEKSLPPAGAEVRAVDFVRFIRERRPLIQPFFRRERAIAVGASHGEKVNGEDMTFLFPFFANGSIIRYVPRPMYLYRMTPDSLSTRSPNRHRVYREVYEEARALFHHDRQALRAIEAKIREIQRIETYQVFFSSLWSLHLRRGLKTFLHHPWVVKELVVRIVLRLPFYLHRAASHGLARRAK